MRKRLQLLAPLALILVMSTGCSVGSRTLLDDQSSDVFTNAFHQVKWTEQGSEMDPEEVLFHAGSNWHADQQFEVLRDTRVLLTSDDVSAAPQGVSMTYSIMRSNIEVASGTLPELLVAPAVLQLPRGSYRLDVRVAATYEYRNLPHSQNGDDFVIPRVTMKEVG